ncbi:hypothetical protein EEB14_55945 [Rhodococcus sp. WS4]|nr:hypothetical protein EEB14_55945 [Rhodococcus sp. WS4]
MDLDGRAEVIDLSAAASTGAAIRSAIGYSKGWCRYRHCTPYRPSRSAHLRSRVAGGSSARRISERSG